MTTPAGAIDVRGLRVLVSAGGTGIGRSVAEHFAAAGARVHVTDIVEAAVADATAACPGIAGTVADASRPEDADRVFAAVNAGLGGLDVLVNNVGIAGPTGGVDSFADADVERTIAVNLTSHFYFLNRFVPLLKDSPRHPSILAIGSVAGRLGYGFRTPYAATKWAIVGLVKSLAIELGPEGVRANAILPGVVSGPRMDRVIAARAEATGVSTDVMRAAYLEKISLRRMVEAEDVANLALFLASGLARNITGQAVSVDGNVEHL
jgi:NAD(P)-dependent dehydrogenase (short-subunit alcohol dehydrogenase family)